MDEKEDRVMKAAREYITTIRKGLAIWEHWINEGNTIIAQHKQSFPEVITAEIATIRQLNPQDVKDAILEHEDGIAMRIRRLDEYKLPAIVQYLADMADTNAQLSDNVTNSLIDEYRLTIETKTRQLLKVIKECEKYIPSSKHPIIQKALASPQLLDIFYDRPEVLEDYINFCLVAKTPTERARKAKGLAVARKIKLEYLNQKLHDELESIGIDAGKYKTWQGATNKA